MRNEKLRGEGPWLFEAGEIAPGETVVYDLRNMEYRGRKRYFRPKLPLDSAQFTNRDSGATIAVELNGEYETRVPPNAVEGYNDTGITRIEVTNRSDSATIAAGDVVIEVTKSAYGADERARQRRERGVIGDVVEKFTGVGF